MVDWIGISIGVGSTLLVGVASIVATLLYASHRVLAWTPSKPRLLADAAASPSEELTIRYEDHEVRRVRLHEVRLTNKGLRAVRAADFEGPLKIVLTADDVQSTTKVLWARIDSDSPRLRDLHVQWSDAHVTIPPTLWNRGDWARISILADEPHHANLEVTGDVADVRIKRVIPSERRMAWAFVAMMMYAGLAMMGPLLFLDAEEAQPWIFALMAPILAFFMIAAFLQSDVGRTIRGLEPLSKQDSPKRWL